MNSIFFFGYGANRNREKIKQVIGKYPELEFGVVVEGYQLAYQTLDQIPKHPQAILRRLYGDTFRAYTLRKGEGYVGGVVWQITSEDLKKIKEWEFVGLWREIVEIPIKTSGNKSLAVLTEKAPDTMPITDIVDGLWYDEFTFINQENLEKKQQYYTDSQLAIIREELKKVIP